MHSTHPPHAPWVTGLLLIALGLIFLLLNAGLVPSTGNWWALLILLPALLLVVTAWRQYRADGALTRRVAGTLSGALFPLTVALMFLLDLDWGRLWPVFVILPGLSMLLRGHARPVPFAAPNAFDRAGTLRPRVEDALGQPEASRAHA